jgi:hypothetical protein
MGVLYRLQGATLGAFHFWVRGMARAVAEIEREIRALKPDDQEHLLRALLEELDGPADPDAERAWLAEAQRRSQELDSGVVNPIPAKELFGRARAELKPR